MGFYLSSLLIALLVLPSVIICAPTFALYTMTGSAPNMLNIFSGASDGTLTYSSQVSTGGNGGGIQSQSSIVVIQNYIFLVNANSSTVAMFSIDETDPTQVTMVGSPVSSGGDWPNSITAFGSYVCVVNTGANNGLRCYTFSSTGLTAISGSDRSFGLALTTPPVTHTGPAQIAFTPDGSALIISIKGLNPPVYLYTFSSGTVGTTAVKSSNNGMVNFGFTFDVDGTIVLVDAAPYGNNSGVIYLTWSASSLSFTTSNYFLIGSENAACWIQRSSATGHFYIANAASAAITEMSRSGNMMNVIAEYPLGAGVGPSDLAIVSLGSQDYLYINEGGVKMINAMKLVSGAATSIQTISSGTGANPSGLAAYLVGKPNGASVMYPLLSVIMMLVFMMI